MGMRTKVAIGSLAAIVVVAASAMAIGRAAFERRLAGEATSLLAASTGREPRVVTEADLATLPDPVQRWLRWARVPGTTIPRTVRLTQEGRFRLGPDRGWMPFTAEEVYSTDPPGFVWTTEMRMLPLVDIVGRDRYAEGRGSIEMRALGVFSVARASGPALDQGALLRYLNETIWFPAAVLSPAIRWSAIDEHSARATISDGEVTADAVFFFDQEGRPVDMIAERQDLARGRLETWSTPLTAYGEFSGIRIPSAGTAVWKYDGGDFTYIELRVTGVTYDPPPAA